MTVKVLDPGRNVGDLGGGDLGGGDLGGGESGAPSIGDTVLHGLAASAGSAVGPVRQVRTGVDLPPDESPAADVADAARALAEILESVAEDLDLRAQRVEGESRSVLEATAMIARDSSLCTAVCRHLDMCGPATALDRGIREIVDGLSAAGDYWRERAGDLLDIRDRAVARWRGVPEPGIPTLTHPQVLVARDLAPADAALLDPQLVLGIVLEAGGPTAHTAIVAAQLGIPCAVRVAGATSIPDGTEIAVDGGTGHVTVRPSADVRTEIARRTRTRQRLRAASNGPGCLADGVRIALCANVGTPADARQAAATDVEGVGLFRTELLFGACTVAPTTAEQRDLYVQVLTAFGARPVTIRTLDAGADKPLPFAQQDAEDNPALGLRGVRHSTRFEDLLLTQLDAIAQAQAATGAQVKVMAPMVATAAEAVWFAQRCRARGLSEVGVMVEVPAAALRARDVLAPVDFASIGTNDLAQYVMAADRMNGQVSGLLSAWQPALLDLVAMTVAGAGGRPVGVCGGAAADPLLALVLAGLGVTGLSMPAARVAEVRQALSLHTSEQCAQFAERARAARDPEQARSDVLGLVDPAVVDLL